jgi:hypothetical protein
VCVRVLDGAQQFVIPSRANGEGPLKRSFASALYHALTSSYVWLVGGTAICKCEVPRRLRGLG